jgi:hypothetical protein
MTTMPTSPHMLRWSFVAPLLLVPFAVSTSLSARRLTNEDTVRSVRRALERLPYYGVFDYIVSRIDAGTVYLAWYTFNGRLRADAEMAVKRARNVAEVANKIEVLPASKNDDRICWATFYPIYTDDFLSRYAPGGVYEVLRELRDERRFPGMQPVADTRSTSS